MCRRCYKSNKAYNRYQKRYRDDRREWVRKFNRDWMRAFRRGEPWIGEYRKRVGISRKTKWAMEVLKNPNDWLDMQVERAKEILGK